MDGPGTAVRVTPSRARADEWAVVLAAADVPHWLRHRLDGWALVVSPADAEAATATLDAYDRENADERPAAVGGAPAPEGVTVAGVAVALLLIGFFPITGPRSGRSAWFEAGSADAARIVAGEWWRAVTALTLHADAPHLVGNAVGAALLVTAVCRALGPGVGLALLLLAGVAGNLLTAAAHGRDHVSVGASTAIFGALGILAALRVVSPGRVVSRARRWWVVVAATFALLAMLGTGPNADLGAHVFGLLAGGVLGAVAALTLRPTPGWPIQAPLIALAALAVYASWRIAL